MHGSKSEYQFRRTTFSCIKPSEVLGTISEETHGESSRLMETTDDELIKSTPTKSATFHGIQDLRKNSSKALANRSTAINPISQKEKLKRISSQPSSSRKRSIFYEMGERIRLFSTASFVSPAIVMPTSSEGNRNLETTSAQIPKSHSLNSFEDSTVSVFVSARCPSGRGRKEKQQQQQQQQQVRRSEIAVGSLLSLQSQEMEMDLEKGFEKDVSQLGILCHHCSTTDLACPKAQKELPSPSASSVYSLARSDLSNEPLCRICHCCWPPDSNDPLISPCRCSGSLQYVHVSCLMHWLDISSRKLHRPAICELCLYKYRRRRVLKYREMKLPQCAQADIRYYTLFVFAILMMVLSAFATVVCFQLEKSYGLQGNRSIITTITVEGVTSDLGVPSSLSAVPDETTPGVIAGGGRKRIGDVAINAAKEEYGRREETENILSTVTLIAAMIFFLSFFLAMYAHVKSGLSFCGYLTLCWSSNLEWSIEEYKHSRDTQYLNKLEELRRKINEKQKKAADEVEPLRSSVIVLE